jgi:hypothetical protein
MWNWRATLWKATMELDPIWSPLIGEKAGAIEAGRVDNRGAPNVLLYFRPSRSFTFGQSRLSAMKAARSGQRRNGFVARSRPIVELGRTP